MRFILFVEIFYEIYGYLDSKRIVNVLVIFYIISFMLFLWGIWKGYIKNMIFKDY